MEEFILKGESGNLIKIRLPKAIGFPQQPSPYGGYDVQGNLEIKVDAYQAGGRVWFSTGQIIQFYEDLANGYESLSGKAAFYSAEGNLELSVTFENRGRVDIQGQYISNFANQNKLTFELVSDQSYFGDTLVSLRAITEKYSD